MDDRFLQHEGMQAYTGSELLLKGALEGGVALVTGYPGSPLADFFDLPPQRQRLLDDYGIVFQMANNEALAAARLNGSQMADVRAMAVMKSVGAHVASDGLALGNLAAHGHRGGAIVVIGDDPWNESTQVPADSRFMAQHIQMPVLEPSTFQELKDWVAHAFDLSSTADLLIAYLVTTNQADGGGTVTVYPNHPPRVSRAQPVTLDASTLPLEQTVMLPPRTSQQENTLEARATRLHQRAAALELHQSFLGRPGETLGFISAGMAYTYLMQAFEQLGVTEQFPMLKLGVTYPVDPRLLMAFAADLHDVVVVEEKRGFLESQVTTLLKDAYQQGRIQRLPRVWGKQLPAGVPGFPVQRGLNPSIVMGRLAALLQQRWSSHDNGHPARLARIDQAVQWMAEARHDEVSLPKRTPTFCPGCPHRDSSSVFLDIQRAFRDPDYMRRTHERDAVDLIFHGDTGCYTMLMFEPNKSLMHNYSGMGLGGGTGAGIDPFITNKQVVFMGDGTFFHSGMIAISDSIKHGQDIAYVILDNKTTAMTGHQPTPSVDLDVMGHATVVQEIEAVLRGLAHGTPLSIHRANPGYHETYRALLEEVILQDGVKVVIADKECGITANRRRREERRATIKEQGYLPEERRINITPEVCEYCLECTKSTGCPGLTITDTPYGKKIATDLSNCVEDRACTQALVCPSFEEVIIHRKQAPARQPAPTPPQTLPEPVPRQFEDAWYAYIAGVGGMGIGVITAILVRAGMREGFHVKFSDRKGLAIRNGGVYSYVGFLKENKSISPVIPYGCADIIMGMDALEAVRGIDPNANFQVAHPARTIALINTFKMPTIEMLTGKEEDHDTPQLERWLKGATRAEEYTSANLSVLSEERFGSNLYANLIMLGLAYQRGLLPIQGTSLTWAIDKSVPQRDRGTNVAAFTLGRELALGKVTSRSAYAAETLDGVVTHKIGVLRHTWNSRRKVARYKAVVLAAQSEWQLPTALLAAFARRYGDLIEYDSLAYADQYRTLVEQTYRQDDTDRDWQATRAVIHYLHKVMAIKDEVYVAHLLTSPEKLARDTLRYRIDEINGDWLEYVHLNRPQFTVWGREITFRLNTRNWQLRLMRHCKFLRRMLPQWHQREKAFRDWYLRLVEGFTYYDQGSYDLYVEIFRLPEEVRGYREVRYPTMDAAMQRADQLLSRLHAPTQLPKRLDELIGIRA